MNFALLNKVSKNNSVKSKEEFDLDIFFKKDKIYLEYDGSGHTLSIKFGRVSENEFYEKENKRKQYLRELGYKEFRLISTTDTIPNKKELLKIIKKLPEDLPIFIRVNACACSERVWDEISTDGAKTETVEILRGGEIKKVSIIDLSY